MKITEQKQLFITVRIMKTNQVTNNNLHSLAISPQIKNPMSNYNLIMSHTVITYVISERSIGMDWRGLNINQNTSFRGQILFCQVIFSFVGLSVVWLNFQGWAIFPGHCSTSQGEYSQSNLSKGPLSNSEIFTKLVMLKMKT